jgi:hypothetical protein
LIEYKIISSLNNNKLVRQYTLHRKWFLGFGAMCVVSWDFLNRVVKTFPNLFEKWNEIIRTRTRRMGLERCIAVVFSFVNQNQPECIYGDIFKYMDKYSPETVKLALLQTNYRGDINITDDLFPEAEKHLVEFYKVFKQAKDNGIEITGEYPQIDEEFNSAMDDDFNTALAISNLYGYFKTAKSKIAQKDGSAGNMLNQIKATYSLLGLFDENPVEFLEKFDKKDSEEIPAQVKAIAEERLLARANKDWAKSDELRNQISALGYEIKDAKDGYTLTRKA